jgi:hypothetical protein
MWLSIIGKSAKRSGLVVMAVSMTGILMGLLTHTSVAGPPAPTWKVVITTAPGIPQDVWFAGEGNNIDGWNSGGCLCLGPLAQGFNPGQHATLLTDIVEGGIFGVDGSPVAPGTYTFPSDEWGPLNYTVANGRTFYVLFNSYVAESNLPIFPVGASFQGIFMFDYAPGRTTPNMVLWGDFGYGFFPLLNEGVLMSNIQFRQ